MIRRRTTRARLGHDAGYRRHRNRYVDASCRFRAEIQVCMSSIEFLNTT